MQVACQTLLLFLCTRDFFSLKTPCERLGSMFPLCKEASDNVSITWLVLPPRPWVALAEDFVWESAQDDADEDTTAPSSHCAPV